MKTKKAVRKLAGKLATLQAQARIYRFFQEQAPVPSFRFINERATGARNVWTLAPGLTRDEVRVAVGQVREENQGNVAHWIVDGALIPLSVGGSNLHLLFVDGLLARIATS